MYSLGTHDEILKYITSIMKKHINLSFNCNLRAPKLFLLKQ